MGCEMKMKTKIQIRDNSLYVRNGAMETKKLRPLEIVIAVLLVTILMAAIRPAVTHASEESKVHKLVEQLYAVRGAIEVYKSNHNGLLPGQNKIGDVVASEDFVEGMIAGDFGLRGLPRNPFSTFGCTVTVVNDADAKPSGDEKTAWWLNTATGEFRACDSKFHARY